MRIVLVELQRRHNAAELVSFRAVTRYSVHPDHDCFEYSKEEPNFDAYVGHAISYLLNLHADSNLLSLIVTCFDNSKASLRAILRKNPTPAEQAIGDRMGNALLYNPASS